MVKLGNRRGLLFVLSSPSGAGKTTISRKLLEQDSEIALSVSYTTRAARPGEENGKDYFFVSKDEFKKMKDENAFLEHAEVFGNFYGTPRKFVEQQLQKGRDILFDIDWQGTQQLAAKMKDDLVSVFILPPSMSELEKRLRTRAQDSEEIVQKRMKKASREISHWNEYDYVLVNKALNETMQHVQHLLEAERLKRSRQPGLQKLIDELLFG